MMTSELYVFAPTLVGTALRGDYQLAGRLRWADDTGRFSYARAWREAQGYALDPLNLPLHDGEQAVTVNAGVPGVLADAGPDSWGRRLLEMQRGALATPLEALRLSNGSGSGCLLFSQSRTRPAPARAIQAASSLAALEDAARQVSLGETVSAVELRGIFDAGSSLGGARPKVNVVEEGRHWIAKFQAPDDDIDVPRLESACLNLAHRAGLDVPAHRLVQLNGRSALLVERFDRPAIGHAHYLSLHALLSLPRVRPADVRAPLGQLTYGNLAALCRQIGVADAGPVLYRRMLFNVMIGNTDDHLRNHGLLFDGSWKHAPSFDMVAIGGDRQALGIGIDGRMATLSNARSDQARFHLDGPMASRIEDEVASSVMQHAREALDASGLGAADVQRALRRMRL